VRIEARETIEKIIRETKEGIYKTKYKATTTEIKSLIESYGPYKVYEGNTYFTLITLSYKEHIITFEVVEGDTLDIVVEKKTCMDCNYCIVYDMHRDPICTYSTRKDIENIEEDYDNCEYREYFE
jgi:hypothetical protein